MGQVVEIILNIRCHNLPGVQVGEHSAVRLGIQKRQEVIEDVPADVLEALFTAPLRVTLKDDGSADFHGPFVQGNPRERFVYLCWGERVGEAWAGFGRVKLQLLTVPRALLLRAANTGAPLEARLDMRDAKGNPIFATVKERQVVWWA